MFRQCLAAIAASTLPPHEVIVADDGSTDDTVVTAASAGARVIRTDRPGSGPALARNAAAATASGDLLFFCDADVAIRPDTLAHIQQVFAADPGLTALFGSYDDQPGDPGFISQYKNIFHHYVHQHAAGEASTFWSGCGIIRREAFLQYGGFSSRYHRPSIEDIELGYRLKCGGHRLRLDKTLQVKHLKRWTLASLLHSDIIARGIPWTRLIMRERAFLNDLNLQTHNRLSVVAVYVGLFCLLLGLWQPFAVVGAFAAALALAILNQDVYRYFADKRGLKFALGVVPMHWLYYFYNGISFGVGMLLHLTESRLQPVPAKISTPAAITLTLGWGVAVILSAAFLRFHALGAPSMWLDELLEIGLAQKSFADIVNNVLSFGAMPLDYFVTRLALQLGEQDFWLRVAPAWWSVLTVALMFRFAGRWWGRAEGIVAAALLAVSAFHVRYAHETRPYALLGLLALASFYFLLRALKTNRVAHWICYALITALCLLTHYFALFVVVAQALVVGLWVAVVETTRRVVSTDRGVSAKVVGFGLALAFLATVLATTPYFDNVIGVGQEFAARLVAPQTAFAISVAPDPALPPPILNRDFFENQLLEVLSGGGEVWRWMFVGLVVVGVVVAVQRRPALGLTLVLWALIPTALTVAFLIHRRTFFAVRYLTPSYLALVPLMAIAVVAIGRGLFRPRRLQLFFLGLIAAIPLALSLAQVSAYYAVPKEDWRATGRFIDSNFAAGDVVNSPLGGGVVFHYTQRADAGRLDITAVEELEAVARGARLWVVMHPYVGPADRAMYNWLAVQPSAVEYRMDDDLRVFVVDRSKSKNELLAAITPPDTSVAWARLAEQYVTLGDEVQAEKSYLRAIALSDVPSYRAAYADYLRQHGRGDEAAQYYLSALDDDPALVPALVGMGRLYLAHNLPGEAVTALTRAAAVAPDDYAANYFLARAYDQLGQPAQASEYRNRASAILPDLIEPP
jgi:glycosyltransferase involved in cell wall biosynthesis/tetratricopeptide (TPR) repeat protein